MKLKTKEGFLTGSRIYSIPKLDSDIDLVIILDQNELEILKKFSDEEPALRFGRLNIIPVPNKCSFKAWKIATDFCKEKGNVSREFAVGAIQATCKFIKTQVFTGDNYVKKG